MSNFFRKNWSLIFALIYLILPDFIPGPVDDVLLLLVERYINKRMELKSVKDREMEVNNIASDKKIN